MATALALSTLGCSLIVSFDEDKRPCGADANGDKLGDCLEGYSCLYSQCIANGSVTRANTCTVSAHCEGADVCAVPGFVCRQPCTWAFGDSNECADANMVCVMATDSFNSPLAACVPGSCETECDSPNDDCVLIKPSLGRCYPACTLSCDVDKGCDGHCESVDGSLRSCQVAGTNSALVCLPATDPSSAPGQDQPCDLVDIPCGPGFGCVIAAGNEGPTGSCLAYCKVTGDTLCAKYNHDSVTFTCQAIPTLAGIGVCTRVP